MLLALVVLLPGLRLPARCDTRPSPDAGADGAPVLSGAFPDDFYCGFYTYTLRDEATARRMAQAGFNAAYVIGGWRQERPWPSAQTESDFTNALRIARKYQMKLVVQAQGDYDYLNPGHTREQIGQVLAPRAVAFLKKYASEPEFLAYCVKEEPKPEILGNLAYYYSILKRECPGVPLYIICNNTAELEAPHPEIMGHDSYPFFWGWNTYGYAGLCRPQIALTWFRRRCGKYWKACQTRRRPMVTVITGQPVYEVVDLDATADTRHVKAVPEENRKALIEEFVRNGEGGWEADAQGARCIHPAWYRAPPNSMRAMAWIAVMEGSKMLFHWGWPERMVAPSNRFERGYSLRITDDQFDELAEACRTFRRYRNLILNMEKQPESVVSCQNESLWHATFNLTNLGRIVVLVNTDTGTLKVTGKRTTRHGHRLAPALLIGERGELLDFTPHQSPKPFALSIQHDPIQERIWNLDDKTLLPLDAQAVSTVPLKPGGGTFLFVGAPDRFEIVKRSLQTVTGD